MQNYYPLFKHLNIVLASGSPRRHQLLSESGVKFSVVIPKVKEEYQHSLKADQIALFLCKLKSDVIDIGKYPDNTVVISADTIVWLNNEVLSKPKDEADARIILKKLSGNMHEVITGVYLKSKTKNLTFTVTTKVFFKEMAADEIDFYLANYAPYDKAGAYGVQEWIGHTCIRRVEGSFVNVMGFPVKEVFDGLKMFV